jgi:hypothetical protein
MSQEKVDCEAVDCAKSISHSIVQVVQRVFITTDQRCMILISRQLFRYKRCKIHVA